MREETDSLDVLAAEARDQLAVQLRDFERLDAKAGVLLGFAGLAVALSPDSAHVLMAAARLTSVVAAIAAVLTLAAGRFPIVDLVRLRNFYLSADVRSARLVILDTHVDIFEEARRLTLRKARLLTVTSTALLVAIGLVAGGFLVSFESGG